MIELRRGLVWWFGTLAPTAEAPRSTATGATYGRTTNHGASNGASSNAASAPDPASATPASSGGAATATTASSRGDLDEAGDVFVVEEMEGGKADVGDFFFTEHNRLTRCKVWRLYVGWYGRC